MAKLPQDFTDLLIELCEAKAEFLLVLSGELQVSSEDKNHVLGVGGVAHVPANTKHGYRNLTDTHFLTIVTKGNATKFFTQVASEVEMSPPDIPGVVRVAAAHGIEFARG